MLHTSPNFIANEFASNERLYTSYLKTNIHVSAFINISNLFLAKKYIGGGSDESH